MRLTFPAVMRIGLLMVVVVLAGCGGSDHRGHSIAQVRQCLRDHDVTVRGGPVDPNAEDADAPDRGELVTDNAMFIAFYSSSSRAESIAPELRKRAEHLNGTLTRHGDISVLYAKARGVPGATGKPLSAIEDCL